MTLPPLRPAVLAPVLAPVLALVLCLSPLSAAAQTGVTFGALQQDPGQPVEITADSLSVDQEAGTAVFSGNVVAVQGALKLSAAKVTVTYAQGSQEIETIRATGGVVLTDDTDAAQGQEAVYTLSSGEMVMTGDVLLTQGASTVAGQRMVLDMRSGTGRVEGRVQTVFTPGSGRTAAQGGD